MLRSTTAGRGTHHGLGSDDLHEHTGCQVQRLVRRGPSVHCRTEIHDRAARSRRRARHDVGGPRQDLASPPRPRRPRCRQLKARRPPNERLTCRDDIRSNHSRGTSSAKGFARALFTAATPTRSTANPTNSRNSRHGRWQARQSFSDIRLTPALTCNRSSTVSRRRIHRSTTAGRGIHHGLGSNDLNEHTGCQVQRLVRQLLREMSARRHHRRSDRGSDRRRDISGHFSWRAAFVLPWKNHP